MTHRLINQAVRARSIRTIAFFLVFIGLALGQGAGIRPTGSADTEAVCAGNPAHDDAPALNAAIATFGNERLGAKMSAGSLRITGGCYLGSSLLIQNKSINIKGDGWGSSTDSPARGYLKSLPVLAGAPMLVIRNSQGVTVEGFRFVGSVSNPPSAAIVFDQQNGSSNEINWLRNLYIGHWQFDSDPGQQFREGIVFSGINGNNGQNLGENIWINGAGVGIDLQHGQYGLNQFQDIEIWSSGTCAVQSATRVKLSQVFFFHSGRADLCGSRGPSSDGLPDFELDYWGSEQSARLADFAGDGEYARLVLHNGYFILWGGHADNDGKFILIPANVQGWYGDLADFSLVQVGYMGTVPTIDMSHDGSGRIRQLFFRGGPRSGVTASNIVYSGVNTAGDIDLIDFAGDSQTFRAQAGLGFPNVNHTNPNPGHYQVVDSVAAKFIGGSGKPKLAAGPGAGASATCGLDATGSDSFGQITCATGVAPAANSAVVTLTFASPAPYVAAHCSLTPNNAQSAELYGMQAVIMSPSTSNTTTFIITSGSAGLAPSTNYAWTYSCGQ